MPHRSSWPPVYPGLTPETTSRLAQPKVSRDDARLLVSIVGNDTILTYICQNAIKQAADYVRANNLTLADDERLFDFLRQRPGHCNTNPPDTSDVPGRVEGGSHQAPRVTNQSAVVGSPSSGRSVKGTDQVRDAGGKKRR